MKAAIFHEVGKPMTIEPIEVEPPKQGEVLVHYRAGGVCHSDHHAIAGLFPVPTPIIMGHEGAGVVEEVGPGVTSVKPGDHVVTVWRYSCGACDLCLAGRPAICGEGIRMRADGTLSDGTTRFSINGERVHHFLGVSTFSSHSVMSEKSVMKIREDMSLEKAAVVSCAVITGVGAVVNGAQVRPGESVAVFGAGGVGLNAVQGAALIGAEPIIAVDLMQNKLEMAKKFGATHTVNSSDEDAVEAIRALTDGKGAHYAFELIGVPEVMSTAFESVRTGGTAVIVGIADVKSRVSIPPVSLVTEEKRLIGSLYGSSNPRIFVPRLIDLYMAGKLNLDDLLTKVWPIEQINEAYDALLNGEVARSVVVHE